MADKCAHEVCFCGAADGGYCGAHCEEHALRADLHPTCECGHVDCEEATMRQGGVVTMEE
jgi:hypothetical protein